MRCSSGAVRVALLCVAALALTSSVTAQNTTLSELVGKLLQPYTHPLGRDDPPEWRPVTLTNSFTYGLELPLKDWKSVIGACKRLFKKENRLMGQTIRMAFHDAFAVDLSECLEGNTVACGGADSSALISAEEMLRPENGHDKLSERVKTATKKVASFYKISWADTLAICSTVAVEDLSGGRVKFFGGDEPTFRVGRLDFVPGEGVEPPKDALPPKDMDTKYFIEFWNERNITLEEGVALMGSHSILELQGCRTGPAPDDICDPQADPDKCRGKLRMFKWDNHYFHEMCSPSITTTKLDAPPEETDVKDLPEGDFKALQKAAICHWTSGRERTLALDALQAERDGKPLPEEGPDDPPVNWTVAWSNDGCTAGQGYGVDAAYCPHTTAPDPEDWFYTVNDAFLGQACATEDPDDSEAPIQVEMRKMLNQTSWDEAFKRGWTKVLNTFVRWPRLNSEHYITGKECKLYVYDKKCGEVEEGNPVDFVIDSVAKCGGCYNTDNILKVNDSCERCCRCATEMNHDDYALNGKGLLEDFVTPSLVDILGGVIPGLTDTVTDLDQALDQKLDELMGAITA